MRNFGSSQTPLYVDALNAAGPFSLLNASRPIPPHKGVSSLIIQFQPTRRMRFQEKLIIRTNVIDLEIPLTGDGVSPAIAMDPADGMLSLGHTTKVGPALLLPSIFPSSHQDPRLTSKWQGNSISKTLTLSNSSAFAVSYVLEVRPMHSRV